jgi:hypothetical protein
MKVLKPLAAIVLLVAFIIAPVVAVGLGQRRRALWKVIAIGLAGGPLLLMALYVPRIAAYDGTCVGKYYFGDRWPCSFNEYLGDQATSLIFTAPLALFWALVFWGTYALCRSVAASPKAPTVDHDL